MIRPLAAPDVPAAATLANDALAYMGDTGEDRQARQEQRVAHFLRHDPAGAWVAEEDGELAGVALAILREGVWGLSLLAVHPDRQARGIGRALLDAALAGSEDAPGIILSATDPKAMRRYARAGFDVLPALAAAGMVMEPPRSHATEVDADRAAPVAERAGRRVRGAPYVRSDLELFAARGARFFVGGDDEGFAVCTGGSVPVLAAATEAVAADLLRACLACAPRGGTFEIEFLTAGQDWAVRVALDAGLALSPFGPVFVRGVLGPLRPWIPSGAFL
jgi:GNAT superfamily N-acetyltransferase